MSNILTWNVTSSHPVQLQRAEMDLERNLEDWIENEPGLVNSDLLIVGRQVTLNGGKQRLDLLTIDRFGNYWGVIEIKRGCVTNDTVGQALGYVTALAKLSEKELASKVEIYLSKHKLSLRQFLRKHGLDSSIFQRQTRNLVTYIVGTAKDEQLDSVASYLSANGTQVNVITFEFFQNEHGDRIIVREMEELEDTSPKQTQPAKKAPTKAEVSQDNPLDLVFETANDNGIGEAYRIIFDAATKHGLVPRVYSQSIMYAPPTDKRRFLIYAPYVKKRGTPTFSVNATAFSEFFPVSYLQTLTIFGRTQVFEMTVANATRLAKKLNKFFRVAGQNSRD